jgi:hypothetical protein
MGSYSFSPQPTWSQAADLLCSTVLSRLETDAPAFGYAERQETPVSRAGRLPCTNTPQRKPSSRRSQTSKHGGLDPKTGFGGIRVRMAHVVQTPMQLSDSCMAACICCLQLIALSSLLRGPFWLGSQRRDGHDSSGHWSYHGEIGHEACAARIRMTVVVLTIGRATSVE